MVFIDGVYSPSYRTLPNTMVLTFALPSAALDKPKYKAVIDKYFNQVAKKDDSLTALNTSFAREGAYIYIPKSVVAEKPIQIIHFSTGEQGDFMLQPRSLVVAEENAQVQIIERHQSLSAHAVLTNAVTEIFAEQNAIIDYYKIQNDRDDASLVDNTYISQQRDSNVKVHTFPLEGKLTRNNLNFYQEGEHIDSTMKGITIIEDQQHVDHYTW